MRPGDGQEQEEKQVRTLSIASAAEDGERAAAGVRAVRHHRALAAHHCAQLGRLRHRARQLRVGHLQAVCARVHSKRRAARVRHAYWPSSARSLAIE